jgi:tetratricopeptide (TPR) repeat protein
MRRLFWWQHSILLLLAGLAAGAQVPDSNQNSPSSGSPPADSATPADAGAAPTTPATKPEVTITGKKPRAERPLPTLPQDEFINCMHGMESINYVQMLICQQQLNQDKHTVIEACMNRSGGTAPARVIQACTELLDRKMFVGRERYFLFADRAEAYFSQGDKQHALDDYNEAIKLAPNSANLYYNRGVFYAAQSDDDAALRDFDTAIGIDSKLVPALGQRAKIYQARGNFSGALADYSEAIRLQPKTAALWSERGYVCLRQRDCESAIKDEAQAIQLDPKLARAYFLRGAAAAFGGLGDRANAVSDIRTGVSLDPSLDRYVVTKGKTAYLALPPL